MANQKPGSLREVGTTADVEEWVVTYHIRVWGDERDRENDHVVTYENRIQARRASRDKKGIYGDRLTWTANKRTLRVEVLTEEGAEI